MLTLPCLKNFSAQSYLVLFCAFENKRLKHEQVRLVHVKTVPQICKWSLVFIFLTSNRKSLSFAFAINVNETPVASGGKPSVFRNTVKLKFKMFVCFR